MNKWIISALAGVACVVMCGAAMAQQRLTTRDTAAASTTGTTGSDPARLARIHAAKMPSITKPILFCTPEADAICSALEVYPADNSWNQVVSNWPLHPSSNNIIASIGAKSPLRCNHDMGFVLVPPNQPRVDVKIMLYPGDSEKGPYPVPANTPIEGWPGPGGQMTAKSLDDLQRNVRHEQSDRHAMIVDPVNRMCYEYWQMERTASGWQASNCAVFDLKSNKLRPDGWTSGDAAGLPIFPATVRYDEIQRGIVEHAMRFTVVKSRNSYVAPATHRASRRNDPNLPRMGERFRLKQNVNISGFSPAVQAVLKGLKKYGMFMADNGMNWGLSISSDPRISQMGEELRKIKGSDFEVVLPPK